jgi:tetratricopeptide (TPR) repeat protein
MGKKRITKKKLKEDAFVSTAFETGHFIQENMTRIILSFVGVIVLAGLAWLFVNYRLERAEAASLALLQAQALYMKAQYSLAAEDFERLAEDYSGAPEAEKAIFFAGDSYYNAGEYDQALELFEQCRDVLSADHPLMVNCLVGLAATYEQLKNMDQAIEFYRQALEIAVYDYQKIEIIRDYSRILSVVGKNAEALELMERVIADYPDNPRTGEIIELKAELLAKATSTAQAN